MTAYAELQVTSSFSFLRGASQPDELAATAAALGLAALGVTDRNSLAGAVRMHVAAQRAGIRLVVGARLDFADTSPSVLCFPTDRAAYGRLASLLTLGKRRAEKGCCTLFWQDLLDHGDGQVVVLLPPPDGAIAPGADFAARAMALRARFGDAAYLAAQHLYRGDDAARIAALAALAEQTGLPLVASNDVHAHSPARRPLQDVLTCIRAGCTIDAAGLRLFANAERHLKGPAEMARLFRDRPEALARTLEIARRCRFSLDELRYEYPEEIVSPGRTAQQELEHLTWQGARRRYPGGIAAAVRRTLEHELALIGELDYARYFLTVYDVVRFARERGILCQGRGSAANSAVCYCLGITAVDPARLDLLFERFISAERDEPPDIDVDFEHERREEVIQYVYQKYGRHRAGMTATVIHYRARGAIRDVGKALGLSADTVAALAGNVWGYEEIDDDSKELDAIGLDAADDRVALALALAQTLVGFPRHLSQHVGGFVITRGPLHEVVPIENAAMVDRTVIEWDKDDLDALGMLKIDILALGMLTCVRKAFDLIARHRGRRYELATLPAEDPKVYDMLCQADSIGVFQVESRAQMTMLPRLKPRNFYDLVIEVAIVRPGPIQGDMVHPYLRRRNGDEQVDYPSEALRQVLDKTLGVPLFQEQAMKIAIVAAGFPPAEADALRRAMATFRNAGTIHTFRDRFIDGMVARGYDRDFATRCFKQIEGFGTYGFPESHAASFALLVYVSAWLKRHEPAAFTCALLNSQPMGFYAPAQLVRDAREHGVPVRPVDVNRSEWDCTLEMDGAAAGGLALRLGFRQVKGARQDDIERLVANRGNGYPDIAALWRRGGLGVPALERLAQADAYGSLDLDRRQALWQVAGLGPAEADARQPGNGTKAIRRKPLSSLRPLPLFAAGGEDERGPEPAVELPELPLGEQVLEDYASLRLTLRAHPLALLRAELAPALPPGMAPLLPAAQLREIADGAPVTVAGLVLVRQRPGTAKGVIFMTLEDETGVANVVVWPDMFARFRRIVLTGRLVAVHGRLQREGIVIHIVAARFRDLSGHLDSLAEDAPPLTVEYGRGDQVTHPNPDPRPGASGEDPPASSDTPPPRRPTPIPGSRHPRDQARVLFPSRDFH